MDSQETERLLGEILGSLPEEQRIVINLCYYQEMSYKEISETLGIPENLVRSRLNLGREKVKKQVLALEKKGTKLYGLAPLPFLMFLYRSIEADAAGARPDASSIQEFLGALEGAGNTAPIAGAASPDPGTSIGSMAAKASVPAGVKASIAACTLAAVVGGSVFLAGMIPQKQEQALTPERIEYYSSEGELVQVMEYDPDTPFQTNQHALKTGIPSPLPHRVYEYTEDGMEETLCMSYVYEYDSEGRVIGRFAYDGSSNQEGDRPRSSTEWEFDEEGRLSGETSYGYTDNADDDEPSPVTVTEWIYDEDALICRINNYDIIDGELVLIERGELLCDSDWKPQEAHYEPLIKGLIEQHFTYQYDSSGRLQYYTQYADASFERKREAVEYRYDSKGNLREITVESYSNDENGNRQARMHLLRYVYPDTLMDELGDYEWFVWGSG